LKAHFQTVYLTVISWSLESLPPSNQEMLMSVSEGFFWYARRALKARGGTMHRSISHSL